MIRTIVRWAKWSALCVTLAGWFGDALSRDLVLAEMHPPNHVVVRVEELLASRLATLSGGALNLRIRHSGELGGEKQYWEKVRNGTLDMARINFGELVNDVPAAKILTLPYLFRSSAHMWRSLDGDFGKRIRSEVEKNGAVVLAFYDSGTRSFYSAKRPIQKRSDFVGLRIRVQDTPVVKDLITALGGTPLVLAYDKVFDAFRNGEIDAAENNLVAYVSSGHYRHAPYFSTDEHSAIPEILLMSKKIWDGLQPAEQKALLFAAAESSTAMKTLWAESEAQALTKARKDGAVILEKQQVHLRGIEAHAIKVYSKHITNAADLEVVLGLLGSD